MLYIEFEWDQEKNKGNQIKHGVSFERAVEIWENEERIFTQKIQNNG